MAGLGGCSSDGLGVERDADRDKVGEAAEALDSVCGLGGPCTLTFNVPQGLTTQDVALSTTTSLTVGTGATVNDGAGGYGLVTNFGLPITLIGNNANVGSVLSVAAVNLGTNSRVHGTVKSGGVVFFGAGATVTGGTSIFQTIAADASVSSVVTFTTPGSSIVALPGVTQTLAPGSYGDVVVSPGGIVALTSGSYQFTSLTVLAGGKLNLNETDGPIRSYIHAGFNFAGTEVQTGADGHVLFAVFGTGVMTLSAPLHGTVNAPNSLLVLSSATGPFVGAFFADSILVSPNTVVTKASALTAVPTAPTLAGLPAAKTQPPLRSAADLPGFLQWTYQSRPSQGHALHAAVQALAGNESVGTALVNTLKADTDFGRNLVELSILGDLRTQAGFQYLSSLLATPVPTTGTKSSELGMPDGAVGLVKRQARAVDGVALMLTAQADATLLRVIASPQTDVMVQARAVHDFILRHGPSARATLLALLPANKRLFVDQIDVVANGATYDSRLQSYLSLHPEIVPTPIVP